MSANRKPVAKPVAAAAQPANFPLCGCGCKVPVVTAKALFLSGHDARFAGMVGRGEVEPTEAQAAILKASPRLQAKVDSIAATKARKQAERDAREAAKVAAKVAYEQALAAAK